MGWDAFATTPQYPEGLFDRDLNIIDHVYARAFKNAVKDIEDALGKGSSDALLISGGLDCSDCGVAIQKLTGVDAWGPNLSIDEVQKLVITPYEPQEQDLWVYHSALQFLKVCQEFKLGIRFSY